MKYPAYPEYKDSGVEWLKVVPTTWQLNKIKYSTYLKGRVGWHGLNSNEFGSEGVHLVTGTDFSGGAINWDGCVRISHDRYLEDPYIHLKQGDLLITKDGTIGKLAVVNCLPEKATLNSGIFLIRPIDCAYSTKYMYWILSSHVFASFLDLYKTGSTINHLYQEVFGNFCFPSPCLEEQAKIANFLEYETSKIDALIAKQEKQIELLKEQRQAVISHAVTKGLNPAAPMKDSGIEWLGQIPAHWEMQKLKRLASLELSNVDKHTVEGERLVRVCNYVDVYYNDEITEDMELLNASASNEQIERLTLKKGDVIITKDSETPNDIAIPAIVKNDLEGIVCGYHLAVIRPQPDICGNFLFRQFQSQYVRFCFLGLANGLTRYGLGKYAIANIKFAMPPYQEQLKIAAFLDSETAKIAAIIDNAKKAIELLKEHRSALISAAVTGKIDVRGCVANAANVQNPPRIIANDNSHDAMLFAVVASSLGLNRTLNKIALAKAYYLAGVHNGYVKPTQMQQHAAGPHNPERFDANEAVAISNKWITKISDKADIYNAGNNGAHLSAEFRSAYGDDAKKIYAFIGDIKPLNNDELEICATLYDCWLVRQINKASCTDADITKSFFEYSDRKKKFPASKVADMLKWMKKNKITPEHRSPFVGYADQQADSDQISMAL